jgi:drug/metabolite transporter (DMT)-like permease
MNVEGTKLLPTRSHPFNWRDILSHIQTHGILIAECCIWYASSALSNTLKKQMLLHLPFPITFTATQFLGVILFTSLGKFFNWFRIQGSIRNYQVIRKTAPLAAFQLGGHVFASLALSTVPVAFVHTVKALSPFYTVVLSRCILGTRASLSVHLSLVPLITGVVLACALGSHHGSHGPASALEWNLIGFIYASISTIVFVFQNVFTKHVLFNSKKGSSRGKHQRHLEATQLSDSSSSLPTPVSQLSDSISLDKMNVLYYSAVFALAFIIPVWVVMEGYVVLESLWTPTRYPWSWFVAFQLSAQMVSHFAQSICAFSIIAHVSTVSYSIASLLKRIVIIVFSMIWFAQTITLIQGLGIFLTFVGLAMYQQAKKR